MPQPSTGEITNAAKYFVMSESYVGYIFYDLYLGILLLVLQPEMIGAYFPIRLRTASMGILCAQYSNYIKIYTRGKNQLEQV